MAVVLSLTVVAGLVAAFVVAIRQTSTTYRYEAAPVRDAEAVLRQADRAFLRAVGREDASVSSGARCHFSRVPPDRDIRLLLRCGPVVHFDGSPQRPWDDVALAAEQADGEVRLSIAGDAVPGQALVPGELLTRPDGKRPASPDGLMSPPPPRVAPGAVGVVAGRLPGPVPTATAGRLSGPGDLDVGLRPLGSAGEVELGDGPRRAARGEELLVVELTVRSGAGASLEIVAGKRRTALPEEARDGRTVVAASVPPRVDAVVEVGYRGLTRSLSMRTGRPVGDGVALLDQPLAARPAVAVDGQDAPNGGSRLGSFTIASVDLLAHSEWLGTAPPGQAWVALGLDGFSAPFVSGSQSVRLDLAQSFGLMLADGSVVPGLEVGRPPAGPTVYFAGPLDLRSFVVRVSPTFVVEGGAAPGPLVFGTVEVPVELGPGGSGDGQAR